MMKRKAKTKPLQNAGVPRMQSPRPVAPGMG
jgi:hypothetical protein